MAQLSRRFPRGSKGRFFVKFLTIFSNNENNANFGSLRKMTHAVFFFSEVR